MKTDIMQSSKLLKNIQVYFSIFYLYKKTGSIYKYISIPQYIKRTDGYLQND